MSESPTKSSLERIRTVCLFVVATAVICAGLFYLRPALVPFSIAILFHFSLAPLIHWLRHKWKFPGWLAVVVTGVVGLAAFVGLWILLAASLAQIAGSSGDYHDKLMQLAYDGASLLPLDSMGIEPVELRAMLEDESEALVRGSLPTTVGALAELIVQGSLVILFLIFMLAGKAASIPRAPKFMIEVERSIQRYMLTKVALSALTGLLTWLILALLGVELALVFGVMAFLLNFIPNIGSVIASFLPVPVLLSNGYSPAVIVLAIVLPSAVQFTIGNIVEPKVFGRSLGIHPVVVILTVVLFGLLWGIPGMFLATPLTSVAKIMLDQHLYTKPFARIIEGDLLVFDRAPATRSAA